CTSVCYSDPDEQQGNVYKILSTATHNSFNHKEFLPRLMKFYSERCVNPSNNCVPEVAVINFLKKGNHGHSLTLQVLSGNYASEGVGGGSSTDLEQFVSTSRGWASIWYGYITDTHGSSRPFDGKTYKTMFHEAAHGYGFGHPSGMTYGFAEIYGFEFTQNFISETDRTSINLIKRPNITANIVDKNNHYIKYKLDSVPSQSISTLSARVISPEKISREGRFSVEEDGVYFEIRLGSYPTMPIVVQFFSDSGSFTASDRIHPNQFYSLSPILTVGSNDYYDLPIEVTNGAKYSWANGRCGKYIEGSSGATKKQIQDLWSEASYTPELLRAKNYISSNMSVSYQRWKVDMTNMESFTSTSEPMGTVMTADDGFLCVVQTQP
ncbi:hypothetical protein, partial [Photobacterium damselae]|uniref:hypothetical protein n=1 Tax=Photobacterium damselae TaxID=38293 RepID=UPI002F3F09A0